MLTQHTAMKNPTIQKVVAKKPKLDVHHIVIMFYMLEAENPNSFFRRPANSFSVLHIPWPLLCL